MTAETTSLNQQQHEIKSPVNCYCKCKLELNKLQAVGLHKCYSKYILTLAVDQWTIFHTHRINSNKKTFKFLYI